MFAFQRRFMFFFAVLLIALTSAASRAEEKYNGSPGDIMLQGFHWTSSRSQNPSWYKIVADNAQAIQNAKFDVVWLPPPSRTVDQQGYMPTQWEKLDSKYGTEAELTAAISALKGSDAAHPKLRVLADIVLNHRNGTGGAGADFSDPAFADNEKAVVLEDDCQCVPKGHHDTGTGFGGSRDLDHEEPDVRAKVKGWLKFLNDKGFDGWRYDMVKGYAGRFIREYNDDSEPYLSVGEYWDDDRQLVINWIDATGGRSMAFDFPTRKLLVDAVRFENYSVLKTVDGKPTGAIGWWPAMSVTFIDNHDVEKDHFNQEFPGGKELQGYCYILTHPGTPCVFWTHYFDWGNDNKQKLQELIDVRKSKKLNHKSVVNIVEASSGADGKYAAIIDNDVAMKIGPGSWTPPGAGWNLKTSGEKYAVWAK